MKLLCSTFLLSLFSTTAFAQSDDQYDWERVPQARPNATIFSPLDLPAPNSVRNGAGAPGPDYWQQQVDYEIDVEIDVETRTVHATAEVTYTNNSPDPLDYLWLHLEQNVFREDSIGNAVADAASIGAEPEGDGYTIYGVKHKRKDLPFHVYDTMGLLELPKPLMANGGKFSFAIEWSFVIPKNVFRRFGIRKYNKGTVIEIAQWIPQVAVYDDVNGWNTLPYLGSGEFYTNIGDFNVNITAPRDFVVVATGVLQNTNRVFTPSQAKALGKAKKSDETVMIISKEEVGQDDSRPKGDGPLTWKFEAESVRTFAWACSDAFILDAASVDGVLVQTAYPEEGGKVWAKATQMMCKAIAGYNRRLIPYPYPVATNVLGPEGGMEYPMIVFCNGSRERGVYGVTTHEIGHNWFPMMINTDERRHAWMDEGFDTFINGYSTEDWFGPQRKNENDPADFAFMMQMTGSVPIITAPDKLPAMALGLLEYSKTGVGLTLLRETIVGPERFDFAFKQYMNRWKFKSPQPADFFRTIEDAAGMDLAWFWRGWFMEAGLLDQAISGVGRKNDRIRFENLGELVMPLHYRITYTDGSTEDFKKPVEIWYQSNQIIVNLTSNKEIAEVKIDHHRLFPEMNRDDNTWNVAEKNSERDAEKAAVTETGTE
ncbi:MAG: M1 family metallopeptidase [Planctomycetota bacterium]|nr:M1 family metallopeptidase [Planctomycetota bacterium]